MRKLNLLILLLLALPIEIMADVSRDSLPSNYGNWMNLTEGYTQDHSYNHQKMQVEMDGNTIHLLWAEFAKQSDGTYGLWYRRSTDLGKTWEDARLIVKTRTDQFMNINSGANNKLMAVSNGHVHITVMDCDDNEPDAKWRILYVRSDDGGASFTTNTMGILSSRYEYYRGIQIDSDGDMVVIAAPMGGNNIAYFTSKDGGDNFSTQTQTIDPSGDTPGFFDMQVSNGRWVSMTFGTYWYYNLKYGYLFITTSDGTTMSTKQVAPLHSDGVPYANPNVMRGANGNSYNYHPQMAIVGNTIHLMYQGNPGGKESKDDYNHTLYQKSEDFGVTWNEVVDLPESDGGDGMIAAKGENVYVLTTASGGRRLIYYSHDSGDTWSTQGQACWTEREGMYNPNLSYSLVIAPDDNSGKHVYLTGNRYYFIESKDGFETLAKNFVLGSEALEGGTTNYALTVMPDKNSTEHWFMQFQKPYQKEYVETDKSSQDICYRRVEPEPDPSGTKALNLTDEKMIDYRVVIPMTPSLALKKAMTVEVWMRYDALGSFQIAGTSEAASHLTSQYNGGWYIQAGNWYGNYGYFEGGLRTDKSTDGIGVRINNPDAFKIYKMNKWHHVALTYDASAGENNARLYINGMLVASQTVVGDILVGANPISLGTADGYGSKGLLDHFAMFDRALTLEELQGHITQMPTGKEKGCVCLLNFNGTLKDMSGNGNDGLALLDVDFVEHEGIHPPKPDFDAAKDITGRNVTMVDNTESGKAVWWYMDKGPDYYARYVSDTTRHPSLKDLDPGIITINMAACSDNAYAAITKKVLIGGLSKVEPLTSGQEAGVRLTIQGGYDLTYSKQPKVLLHKGGTVIEGKWMVESGYDSKKVESPDDLAKALFNLSNAEPGIYDVVVNNDTLYSAFTVEKSGEPEVWMQVNGGNKQLWNKWKSYSIDYGNKSNVPAYNVPIFIMVSDRKKTVDVSFDFDYELCNPALDDYGQNLAKSLGDHVMAYDERLGDSVRVYSFMIPYIAPNSTGTKTFRIRHRPEESSSTRGSQRLEPRYVENKDFVDVIFWAEDPWGPYDPDAPNPYEKSGTRAPYTMEQGECVAKELGTALLETAIGFVPGVNCMYAIGKTAYQSATEVEKPWSTFGSNYLSTFFSCCEDLIPGAALAQAAFTLGSMAWGLYSAGSSMNDCLNGKPKELRVKGVGSYDPNEMIGPYGYDDNAHYIQPIGSMGYTITYENKSTATAPAHEVYVTDKLDLSKYDPESFAFTSFGWADTTLVVGGSYTKDFTRDVKYKVNGQDIIVRVSGTFDQETGDANWSMVSLDKNGKEIEDADLGYLLPNNADHVGEGFVAFSINHKPNPTNGSTISNKATIVFDANAPIETNVFVNTFDTDYPTSKIAKSEVSGSDLVLTFEGSDATSGVASYDLYVFKNGGEAEVLAYGVTDSQYKLPYVESTKYAFCTIATDHVGWKEAKDVKPEFVHSDAKVAITISSAKQVTYMSDKGLDFTSYPDLKAYVATGYDKGSGTIWLTRVKDVPAMTGFLLMGNAGKYEIPVTSGGSSSYYQNLFKGTIEGTTIYTTEGDNTNYYLSNGDAGVGFYKVTKAEGVALAANRAYLSVPTEIPAVGSEGSTETIKVSSAGQVPYYNSASLDFTSMEAQGVKAYTATGYDYKSGTIWLTRVKQVPAETGILIMAPQGEYPVPTASVASVYANMFKGTLTGTTIQTHETIADEDYINYYLSSGDAGVGFYKVTKEGGVTIGANRCYLPIKNKEAAGTRSAGSGQSQIAFEEADEVIGIQLLRGIEDDNDGTTNLTPALSDGEGEGAWYTLQGQRVAKPGKGLYIHNGKVVVIRSTTK